MYCDVLVEGYVDEAVAWKLLRASGHEAGTTYGKKGWVYIARKIAAFDRACGRQGLLTLVDFMDTGAECPPAVVRSWLEQRAPKHIFRLVVREIESWILADRRAAADFLCVPLAKIPVHPDTLDDPKQTLIGLARTSRSKNIRDALVPHAGYAAAEGPLYASEMARFVTERWDPDAAKEHSDSLARCLKRLNELRDENGCV